MKKWLILILIVGLFACDKSKKDFETAAQVNTIAAYNKFLEKFPEGKNSTKAQQRICEIELDSAMAKNSIDVYNTFLEKYPSGKSSDIARQKLSDLEFEKALQQDRIEVVADVIEKYPHHTLVPEAQTLLEKLEWKQTLRQNSITALEAFIEKYPDGQFVAAADAQIKELRNPFKILQVTEDERLDLAATGFSGWANAADSSRFVCVQVEFRQIPPKLESKAFFLASDNQKVFDCEAIGDDDGDFCWFPSIHLDWEEDRFSGWCIMVVSGQISFGHFSVAKPIFAFSIPDSIQTGALSLSYNIPVDSCCVDTVTQFKLSNGLTYHCKTIYDLPSTNEDTKLLMLDLVMTNQSKEPLELHRGNVQLFVPSKSDSGEFLDWRWEQMMEGPIDMTGAVPDEQRFAQHLLKLVPQKEYSLVLGFMVDKEIDPAECQLRFFSETRKNLTEKAK
jgi:hypothetical protein